MEITIPTVTVNQTAMMKIDVGTLLYRVDIGQLYLEQIHWENLVVLTLFRHRKGTTQ